jgi:hypothetical protein
MRSEQRNHNNEHAYVGPKSRQTSTFTHTLSPEAYALASATIKYQNESMQDACQ